jgi:hypothetical protein
MKKAGKNTIGLTLTFLLLLATLAAFLTIVSAQSPLNLLKEKIILSLSNIINSDEKQSKTSELSSEIARLPISTQQCKVLCVKNYTTDIKNCDNIHRSAIRNCNELREQMLEECRGIHSQEEWNCIRNAVEESKRCKESALENFNMCKTEAKEKRMLCKSLCEPITCCLNDSECFKSTITQCRNEKGAVMECLPIKHGGKPKITQSQNFTLINTTTQSNWLKNLTNVINNTNISTAPYVPGSYVCHNFTDDLERNLTAAGYNATFTAYWCYNNAGKPTIAHAVTDVHALDGSLVFIEPQTGQITNLDFDGDGKTEARTHHENAKKLTDDNCEIEVYDNKAAALAAGVPM